MPRPFTGPKMFCASPNFLSQPRNLTAFSASSKTFVLAQKTILLNTNHILFRHKMFVTGTICKQILGLAQKIWTSTKHFGTGKRTRRKNSKNLWNHCGQSLSHAILTKLHTILHIFKHKSLYDKTKNKLVLIKILTTKALNLLSVSSHFGNFIFGCFGRWSYQNITK